MLERIRESHDQSLGAFAMSFRLLVFPFSKVQVPGGGMHSPCPHGNIEFIQSPQRVFD